MRDVQAAMKPGRVSVVLLAAIAALSAAACASTPSPRSGIPPEFAAACGHPGVEVTVTAVPVTIAHRACDLRGVVVRYGAVGATVPTQLGVAVNGAAGVVAAGTSPVPALEIQISVAAATGDVTITGG
jgi:hypothetical protein